MRTAADRWPASRCPASTSSLLRCPARRPVRSAKTRCARPAPRRYRWLRTIRRGRPMTVLAQDASPRPDIADPATYTGGVPHREFARRRAYEPVGWVPEPVLWRHSRGGRIAQRGTGFWAVTTHEAVLSVSRRTEEFSSGRSGVFLTDPRTPGELAAARQLLINMDAPQHVRIRKIVTSVFTPRSVRRLLDSIAGHAAELVDKVVRADRFDAVGDIDAYRATMAEAFAYARRLAAARREQPTDDLVSRMANAELDGQRLSDREFCNLWLLLVVAGNETTRHLIAGSLQALVEHPGERDRLVSGAVPVPTAVEELLRWVTPIMQFRRTATRDTELCGQHIAEGDKVVIYYTSANRDAAVFADPDRLDLAHDPNPHLAFGIGPHFCLGAHLARLELTVLLETIRPYLPGLQVVGPVTRLESNFVNAIKSMPARIAS